MTGRKDDKGKPRTDLLDPKVLLAEASVLGHGAKRYGDNNWRLVENAKARYTAALLRHMYTWMAGESTDPDTGESHLAHVRCNAMFLQVIEMEQSDEGDTSKHRERVQEPKEPHHSER